MALSLQQLSNQMDNLRIQGDRLQSRINELHMSMDTLRNMLSANPSDKRLHSQYNSEVQQCRNLEITYRKLLQRYNALCRQYENECQRVVSRDQKAQMSAMNKAQRAQVSAMNKMQRAQVSAANKAQRIQMNAMKRMSRSY